MTVLDNLRVECAFTTTPDDPNPAWTDISPYVDLTSGVSITAGRQDEFATVQTGSCRVMLNNIDGRFTPGNVSSPYYPNVKIRKRIRVTYFDPAFPAVPHYRFTGYVEEWPTDWPTGDDTYSSSMVTASDRFKRLGQAAKLKSIIEQEYLADAPSAYYTLGEATGAATAGDTSKNAGGLLSSVQVGTGGALTFGANTGPGTDAMPAPAFAPLSDVVGQFLSGAKVAETSGMTLESFALTSAITVGTNLLTAEDSSFEGGTVGTWLGYLGSTVVNSSVRAFTGTKSLVVTWQTGNPVFAQGPTVTGLTVGLVYVVSAYVWVPTGHPAVRIVDDVSSPLTSLSSVNDQWQKIAGSFKATATSKALWLNASSATSGQQVWIDAVRLGLGTGVQQTIMRMTSAAAWVELSTTPAGKASATDSAANFTLTSTASVNDGVTHHIALTQSIAAGVITARLVVDGTSVGSATYTGTVIAAYDGINVGGNVGGTLFDGTIAHVATNSAPLSVARLAAHYAAGLTGFAGERSDQRIARLGGYAGVTAAQMALDVGSSTSIAFVDTTGLAPLAAMQDVTATEGGVLFIDGQGLLTFKSRAARYNTTSALTIGAADIDQGARFIVNDLLLVNDVTAGRAGGAKIRVVNAASVTDYGTAAVDLTLLTTSDAEVANAANWKSNISAAITPRLPSLTMDLLTVTPLFLDVWYDIWSDTWGTRTVELALQLRIGSRVTLSGLPAQAPASSVDLFVEGWSETISINGWTLALNTSPAAASSVWVLDSLLYSQLDSTTRLAY